MINLQKSNSQEITVAVESIKKEFLIQLEKFQTTQATHAAKSKEFIEQQAQEMEQVSRESLLVILSYFNNFFVFRWRCRVIYRLCRGLKKFLKV